MHEGQKQFFAFIMNCAQEDKRDIVEGKLLNNFKLQAENVFTKAELGEFQTEIIALLKPEAREEVKTIMDQFGESHVSK